MPYKDRDIIDVSLDLETTGTSAGCGVISIGATTFDLKNQFYERIAPDSLRAEGLREDIDTIRWWHRQERQLMEEAFGGILPLREVLDKFHDWFRLLHKDNKNVFIWGNGADFDLPILKECYLKTDRTPPWATYNGRCYRTLQDLLSHVKAPPRASRKHHALDDAIYQAEHAVILLQML